MSNKYWRDSVPLKGGMSGLKILPLVLLACSASAEITQAAQDDSVVTYEIVTMRNASDVAGPASNPMDESDSPIGHTISISASGITMPGLGCDSWEVSEGIESVVNLKDPMLADINIAPTDSPLSSGDKRIMKSYAYACEGEAFLRILQVDERVIVIPWANDAQYLVAEKPLSSDQIVKFQKELKSMKFYSGEMTGVIDEPTRIAIKRWAKYRAVDRDAYSFYRPALTQNLLDALGVLDRASD